MFTVGSCVGREAALSHAGSRRTLSLLFSTTQHVSEHLHGPGLPLIPFNSVEGSNESEHCHTVYNGYHDNAGGLRALHVHVVNTSTHHTGHHHLPGYHVNKAAGPQHQASRSPLLSTAQHHHLTSAWRASPSQPQGGTGGGHEFCVAGVSHVCLLTD